MERVSIPVPDQPAMTVLIRFRLLTLLIPNRVCVDWTPFDLKEGMTSMRLAIRWVLPVTALVLSSALNAQESNWRGSLDGRVFAQYMSSGTVRGAQGFAVSNWFAGSVARDTEAGTVSGSLMMSLEPLTVGECGYPRLITPTFLCFSRVLEDRAPAHPLIMDASVQLTQKLSNARAIIRLGIAGEPAFGPVAYFHRSSAQYDPVAPLAHDRFNPQHTAYGLFTVGVGTDRTLWEVSAFNGTGLDDNPYDLDFGRIRSIAGRGSVTLGQATRMQASFASFQPSPGGTSHHGQSSAGRMTAYSATIARAPTAPGLAYTAGWAAHRVSGETQNAGLLEAQYSRRRHAVFGRVEVVRRVENEILIDSLHNHTTLVRRFNVGELSGGYALRLAQWRGLETSLGARASLNTIPEYIRPRYFAKTGTAFAVFGSVQRTQAHQH